MNMTSIRILMIGCFLSLTHLSCAELQPFIQDFNMISHEQELELSGQLHEQIKAEMTLVTEGNAVKRVDQISGVIVSVLPRKDFDYQFYVIEDETPNAFTIPGGRIYVHTGLLTLSSDDSEIAGVIAHEIGHAVERHPTKNISRAYGVERLAQMIFKNTEEGTLKQIALGLAKGGFLTRYSREDEREADLIGYYLLDKSKYDNTGLINFLKKIAELQRNQPTINFLSTHPPTQERIDRLEALNRGEITVDPQVLFKL